MTIHALQTSVTISAPLGEVFEFFSHPENLERLAPEYLRFHIATPMPIEMTAGATLDYRLRMLGIRFGWRSEITVWEPGVRFVDVQVRGPYRLWEHEHRFFAEGSGTRMEDHLRYAAPGWILEPLIHRFFVRRRIEQIFKFRNAQISEIFGGV